MKQPARSRSGSVDGRSGSRHCRATARRMRPASAMWHRKAMRRALVVLALCACGQPGEQTAPAVTGSARAPTPPDAAAVPGPVVIAPHSNEIALVAVGDRADVALTAD